MIDRNLIRSVIRDVIAEEVKALKAGKSPAPAAGHAVRISDDADLAAFAREVLRLAENPQIRAAILAGRHPFHLAVPELQGSAGHVPAPSAQGHRVDEGVVTEAHIAKLPQGTARLLLGPRVSITPLARDKARARNIGVERIAR